MFEEFLFRGYAQFTLATGIGFWPAATALSAAFGAVHLHNSGERQSWRAQRVCDCNVFLLDVAADRELVVCGRIARRLRLGRDIFVFRAGQRPRRSRPLAEFLASRRRVAHGRRGGSRGQRHGICGCWNRRRDFHLCLSGSCVALQITQEFLLESISEQRWRDMWRGLQPAGVGPCKSQTRRLKPAPHKSRHTMRIVASVFVDLSAQRGAKLLFQRGEDSRGKIRELRFGQAWPGRLSNFTRTSRANFPSGIFLPRNKSTASIEETSAIPRERMASSMPANAVPSATTREKSRSTAGNRESGL